MGTVKMSAPLLDHLSRQIRAIETSGRSLAVESLISTGCSGLDQKLPRGGYEPGTIIEWLEPSCGSGGWYLALAAARQSVGSHLSQSPPHPAATASDFSRRRERLQEFDHSKRDSKYWVVVDRKKRFYPPAAQAMGLPLERLIVLHPNNQADEAWAVDQALRCSAVGAVVAELESISELQARRFQLAAEQGQTLGLFLRPAHVRNQPSWSEIQWLILNAPLSRSSGTGGEGACNPSPLSRSSERGSSNPTSLSRSSGRGAGGEGSSVLVSHRRIDIQALRIRGGKAGQRWTLVVDLRLGHIALEEPHAVSSSLCLASQLAMSKGNRHERSRVGSAAVRAAGA